VLWAQGRHPAGGLGIETDRLLSIVQQRAPVRWDAPLWAGDRLIFAMPARRSQSSPVDGGLLFVVVEPILSGLKARDHRMARRVKMPAGVLAWRAVAAADMPAFGAASQVQPPSVGR